MAYNQKVILTLNSFGVAREGTESDVEESIRKARRGYPATRGAPRPRRFASQRVTVKYRTECCVQRFSSLLLYQIH